MNAKPTKATNTNATTLIHSTVSSPLIAKTLATTAAKIVATIFVTMIAITSAKAHAAGAGDPDPSATACYQETLKIDQQKATGGNTAVKDQSPALSTQHCIDALESAPYTSLHKASMFVNKGLIELAQGRITVAADSFDAALRLQPQLTKALVSRAQIAHRQADLATALDLYNRALASRDVEDFSDSQVSALERNRSSVQALLGSPSAPPAPALAAN